MTHTNINDSLQFLVFCREALSDMIRVSDMKKEVKIKTTNFLMNEASDYQVMSLITRGELPKTKYDAIDESILFIELKQQMVSNAPSLLEYMEPELIASFLVEVGSVYGVASSAKPVLEFLGESNMALSRENLNEASAGEIANQVAQYLGYKYSMIAPNVKTFIAAQSANAAQKGEDVAAAAKAIAGQAKSRFADALAKGAEKVSKVAGDVKQAAQGAADKASQKVGAAADQAQTAGTAALGQIKQAAGSASDAVSKFATSTPGQAVGAAALLALISYGAYKLYKNKFSAAAKACAGRKGPEKAACMAKAKKAAIMAQIADMRKASSACAKAKDPAKCKAAAGAKIQKLQAKAAKVGA